ncbi:MAG: phenylalanine--tRNA ligase subunit alpha [Candidatus Woesearchaeota archaeon]|jgi:phenylalanyl-tRNA synthetase alpha chain
MDKQIEELVLGLHPLEIALLPHLRLNDDFDSLVSVSKLKDIEVMRAMQWLSNKGVLEIKEDLFETILLDLNGKKYSKSDLPEIRFLHSFHDEKEVDIDTIVKRGKLEQSEVNICIGELKKACAITITKDQKGRMIFSLTSQGERMLKVKNHLNDFLKREFPVKFDHLKDLELHACLELLKRKQILIKETVKKRTVKLTELGNKLCDVDLRKLNLVDSVTTNMIKSGEFSKLHFRRFDITSPVPTLYRGKRHFVNQSINYIKRIWLEMGFVEMTGGNVQTSFWDLDSLFVPQDHPARTMQDTFYLKDYVNEKKILHGDLPSFYTDVQNVHEHGGKSGSRGWQMNWNKDESSEVLLRTHTTVLSAHIIKSLKKEDLPVKIFSVGKVFRNESLDWKHLFEFHQVEGIVIDKNVNFRHLIGYLKLYFGKMGFSKVRIRPHHFPYTEPSVEVDVYDDNRKEWLEMGGAGLFRPEVSYMLFGEEVPVLAWGTGLERAIKEYFNISDIRDLYLNDLDQIRNMKEYMK